MAEKQHKGLVARWLEGKERSEEYARSTLPTSHEIIGKIAHRAGDEENDRKKQQRYRQAVGRCSGTSSRAVSES